MNYLFAERDDCGAEISDDELYRYALTRKWSSGPQVAWLCFNPSVADGSIDDPSVRKMVGFSKRWEYGRLVLVNLFAFRSTDPRRLKSMGSEAIGPLNGYWIEKSLQESKELICAWGCAQHSLDLDIHANNVLSTLRTLHIPISCLGYRKDGHPKHPLMLAYDTPREPFVWNK
jgi:hypothetical protein